MANPPTSLNVRAVIKTFHDMRGSVAAEAGAASAQSRRACLPRMIQEHRRSAALTPLSPWKFRDLRFSKGLKNLGAEAA
jgi:hypothetical protein